MNGSLISSSIALMGSRGLGVILELLTTVYLARHLSLAAMGQFALAYSLLGLVRATGSFGVDQASVRQIARASHGAVVSDEAQRLSLAGIAIALICGALLGLSMFGLHLLTGVNIMLALAIPAYVFIGLMVGQIRGLGHNLLAQTPEAVGLQLAILAIVVLSGADSAIVALCVAGWVIAMVQIAIRARVGLKLDVGLDLAPMKRLISEGFGIFQAQVFTVLAMRAPVFLAAAVLDLRPLRLSKLQQSSEIFLHC
ncbi:oligosaccharide flippase family protein (plasmid) [Falsihalocynthiibacter sp. SS001]|uniref:oligosaccharide flippase family protein n=1 Tax=Falsihalocynthiibacter sp. SS001 TaxID=3349698 RepID=UPI0036D415AF